MKKLGMLNSEISTILSKMGHTDSICISDCGLPIPDEVKRIDVTVRFGVPSFMEVLTAVIEDMCIEGIVLAEEVKVHNPDILEAIQALFHSNNMDVTVEFISHLELKLLTKECKAVIRTGEVTPYANIILKSGCIFS